MKQTKKGFTLIELMIVMAIIAVLSTLIIGAVTIARRSARDTQRRANMKNIQVALEAKFASTKSYPAATYNTIANINSNLGTSISDPSGDERYCYYAAASATNYTLKLWPESAGTAPTWATACANAGSEDYNSQN